VANEPPSFLPSGRLFGHSLCEILGFLGSLEAAKVSYVFGSGRTFKSALKFTESRTSRTRHITKNEPN
jgi:hypothetical protein